MSLWICCKCNKTVRPKVGGICPRCGQNSCERVIKTERKIYNVLNVGKYINSDMAMTYDQADELAISVISSYRENNIPVLDFSNVDISTGCFMGRLIGSLVESISQEELKSLEIKNATNLIQSIFTNAKNFGIELYDDKVAEALKQVIEEISSEEN